MDDLTDFVSTVKRKQKEVDITNKILELLEPCDLDTAERIISWVMQRIEIDWYE